MASHVLCTCLGHAQGQMPHSRQSGSVSFAEIAPTLQIGITWVYRNEQSNLAPWAQRSLASVLANANTKNASGSTVTAPSIADAFCMPTMHIAATQTCSHSGMTAPQGLCAWHVLQLASLKVCTVLGDSVMPVLSAYHVIHDACIRI